MLKNFHTKYNFITFIYFTICIINTIYSKLFLIIAGIITPALLSLNTTNLNSPYYYVLFSLIWFLQLSISAITSFTSFYKWDKKYFLFMAYKNKIDQEVWLYLELSSKYGIFNKKNKLEKKVKKLHTKQN